MRKHQIVRLLAVLLTLAACQPSLSPRPTLISPRAKAGTQDVTQAEVVPYAWIGTTLWPRGPAKMRLEYQLFGHDLQGEYAVGCSSTSSLRNCVSNGRGFITGTVKNGMLVAQLKVSAECVYTLLGTVTATKLVATAEPTDCPGGSKGEWDLRKG